MATAVPFARENAYNIFRMKFTEELRGLSPSSLFCKYVQTNDVYLVGGLVSIDETPVVSILRHLRELACFRLARNFPRFFWNLNKSYMEHEPIKISLYISDMSDEHLKYCNSYCALMLGNQVIDDMA
jgi:hypothetical protein